MGNKIPSANVLTADLWGRGYSDTPLDVPHDSRLFTSQIFFALVSSKLSWTGAHSGGFSIVGFSLGGGITMSFVAHFPYLVNSIVLLAPGGILRYIPTEYQNPIFHYASLVPAEYLRRVVGKLLGVSMSKEAERNMDNVGEYATRPEDIRKASANDKSTPDIPGIVQWQFDNHRGFCYSFANTIQHGPIMNQDLDWIKVCDIIKGKCSASQTSHKRSKLWNSKLLVIFGDDDGVVVADDVSKDLNQMLGGAEHLSIEIVPGGHGFPVPGCDEVVKHICRFWQI